MPKFVDHTGKKFGRWLVIDRAENNRHNQPQWNCLCECGNRKTVTAGILVSGASRSCGCLNIDVHRQVCIERNTTHGLSRIPEYNTWVNIHQRCNNPNTSCYNKYGAKGITVCKRWDKFENFLADMGKKPTPKHTIDRIDSRGNYTPSNCRWATMLEQQSNRRFNLFITYRGETLVIPEWSRRTGVPIETIRQRLKKGVPADLLFSKSRVSHKPSLP